MNDNLQMPKIIYLQKNIRIYESVFYRLQYNREEIDEKFIIAINRYLSDCIITRVISPTDVNVIYDNINYSMFIDKYKVYYSDIDLCIFANYNEFKKVSNVHRMYDDFMSFHLNCKKEYNKMKKIALLK